MDLHANILLKSDDDLHSMHFLNKTIIGNITTKHGSGKQNCYENKTKIDLVLDFLFIQFFQNEIVNKHKMLLAK